MNEKTKKIIKVLGIAYMILSGLMFFSGLLGTLGYCVISVSAGEFPPSFANFIRQSTLLSFLFENFVAFALGQIIISGLLFYTSFKFLKYQSWARNVLEIFSWFIMGCIILFIVLFVTIVPFHIPLLVKVIFSASMGFWAVPILILIWFIKKKEVVEGFNKNNKS